MSNEEVLRKYASLKEEWSPKFEGKIELTEVRLDDYYKHERDQLKAAIRAAKAELRVARAGAREIRRQGRYVNAETVGYIGDLRVAVQMAKEDYREWKKTRR